jgi:hypothetical protein
MSLNLEQIKPIKVQEPRVALDDKQAYLVLEGGNEVSWKPWSTNSFSTSSFQFSTPPPAPDIIVSRWVMLRVPVTVTLTGTSSVPGNYLFQSAEMAFRDGALMRGIATMTATINNSSASVNMADVYPIMARFNNNQCLRSSIHSMTPSMMDRVQSYGDTLGTMLNPLASYFDYNGYDLPRGAFPMTVVSNTSTSATITTTLCEPIFMSPFIFGQKDEKGFIRVQSMDWNINWLGGQELGAAMWSYAPHTGLLSGRTKGNSDLTSVVVSFGKPELLFNYITPPQLLKVPELNMYDYFVVDRYLTDSTNVLDKSVNPTTTITSNNIQLRSVPNRIYICARKPRNSFTSADPDCYLAIEQITINYQNRSGLVSTATQQDLYYTTQTNGLNKDYSFTEWKGGPFLYQAGAVGGGNPPQYYGSTGSIVCLNFGKDIGLSSAVLAPGVLNNAQLSINVSVRHLSNQPFAPQLILVIVSEGVVNIVNNQTIQQIGVISEKNVLDSRESPSVSYSQVQAVEGGGDFFSSMKTLGKDIYRGLEKVAPIAEDAYKIGKTVAPYVAPLLAGIGDGGVLVSEQGTARGNGAMVGGRKISRNQLRKRLERM